MRLLHYGHTALIRHAEGVTDEGGHVLRNNPGC